MAHEVVLVAPEALHLLLPLASVLLLENLLVADLDGDVRVLDLHLGNGPRLLHPLLVVRGRVGRADAETGSAVRSLWVGGPVGVGLVDSELALPQGVLRLAGGGVQPVRVLEVLEGGAEHVGQLAAREAESLRSHGQVDSLG